MYIKRYLPDFFYNFLSKGHRRTIAFKRNAFGTFSLKGLEMVLGFVRVPLIISFVSVSEYGIWLTLSSVIGWFAFFDIGLSNGLKTKLAEALAKKDYELAKMYVSTTYATISIIIGFVFVIFLLLFPFLNWVKILNVPSEVTSHVSLFVFVFVTLFSIQFVTNILGTVLTADQKPAVASSIGTVSSVIYLMLLLLLKVFTKGSLVQLALICNGTSVFIFVLASVYFYKKKYSHISPSLKLIDFSHFRDLATLGFKFFFIQISAIIMFSTDNLIITQLFTPADVAPYNIALKYMGVPLMMFSLITWPLWVAFTDAYTMKDYDWIRRTVRKLIYIWLLLIIAVGIFLLLASSVYEIWLRGEVYIPFILSCFMGIYSILVAWNTIYVFFLNGIGIIKLQLYMGFITVILNIPLSIYFARDLKFGPAGIILSTIVCIFIGSVWAPIQYNKIINGKAKGIWAA